MSKMSDMAAAIEELRNAAARCRGIVSASHRIVHGRSGFGASDRRVHYLAEDRSGRTRQQHPSTSQRDHCRH